MRTPAGGSELRHRAPTPRASDPAPPNQFRRTSRPDTPMGVVPSRPSLRRRSNQAGGSGGGGGQAAGAGAGARAQLGGLPLGSLVIEEGPSLQELIDAELGGSAVGSVRGLRATMQQTLELHSPHAAGPAAAAAAAAAKAGASGGGPGAPGLPPLPPSASFRIDVRAEALPGPHRGPLQPVGPPGGAAEHVVVDLPAMPGAQRMDRHGPGHAQLDPSGARPGWMGNRDGHGRGGTGVWGPQITGFVCCSAPVAIAGSEFETTTRRA
jgi:hypothetical protein